MTKQIDHHTALSKAKIQLMARPDSAFFTTVLFSLKQIWDETIPTLCTNGRYIKINPKFFLGLGIELQISALIHEAMHVAYIHMARLGTRKPKKFNYAADYVINLQLHERGFKIGDGWLLDAQYAGMPAEQVYDLLPEDMSKPNLEDLEYTDGDEVADEVLTQEIQDILVRASIQSKLAGDKPGTVPGDIQILLDRLLNPKLPWNRILQKYLQSFTKNDYSFRKPNRRFFPKHHLPSLWGESLSNLLIAVDISGSVSDEEFRVFVSEVNSILRMMKPEKITLVQFDTEIKSVNEVRNTEELMKIHFVGRGGTEISPVLELANKLKPQAMLIFTDGGFRFRDVETNVDTLWIIHNNPTWTAPYGKVIHYEIA